MSSLKKAHACFTQASASAEAGRWIESAWLCLQAYQEAQSSTAQGAQAFAYRMWNATQGAASTTLAVSRDMAVQMEARAILRQLKGTK